MNLFVGRVRKKRTGIKAGSGFRKSFDKQPLDLGKRDDWILMYGFPQNWIIINYGFSTNMDDYSFIIRAVMVFRIMDYSIIVTIDLITEILLMN